MFFSFAILAISSYSGFSFTIPYPEAALKELGQLMASPLGKSGVNHRLRKLSEIAQGLREQQGGASRYD